VSRYAISRRFNPSVRVVDGREKRHHHLRFAGQEIGWPQTFACVDAIVNSAVSDIRILTNEGGIVSTNRFGAVVLSHSHEVGDLPEFLVAEKQSASEVNTK
jgi:hypothetical protein